MSSIRIILAAIVGGVVVFIWGAVAHMILPIGDMGIRMLPAEQTLLPQMKQAILERGFYFFPGMEAMEGREMTEEARRAWEEKYRAGPRGDLGYYSPGEESEAVVCLDCIGEAWSQHANARAWLKAAPRA